MMLDGAELLSKKNEKLVIVDQNITGYFTGNLRFERGKEYIQLNLESSQTIFAQIESVEFYSKNNKKWKA